MMGDVDEARRRLIEGADTHPDHPLAAANCLALLALLETEQGHWTQAEELASRARQLLGDTEAVPSAVVALAVDVLVKTHAGRANDVEAGRQLCRQHFEQSRGMTSWVNLLARVALARAAVLAATSSRPAC